MNPPVPGAAPERAVPSDPRPAVNPTSRLRALAGLGLAVFAGALLGLAGLPWWTIVVVAAVAGYFFRTAAAATAATAFAAGFLSWWGVALYQHLLSGGVLTGQVGQIFLGLKSPYLLFVTGLFGGLLASLGALTGRYAAELVRSTPRLTPPPSTPPLTPPPSGRGT
jgi:hypothetical protein